MQRKWLWRAVALSLVGLVVVDTVVGAQTGWLFEMAVLASWVLVIAAAWGVIQWLKRRLA